MERFPLILGICDEKTEIFLITTGAFKVLILINVGLVPDLNKIQEKIAAFSFQ